MLPFVLPPPFRITLGLARVIFPKSANFPKILTIIELATIVYAGKLVGFICNNTLTLVILCVGLKFNRNL